MKKILSYTLCLVGINYISCVDVKENAASESEPKKDSEITRLFTGNLKSTFEAISDTSQFYLIDNSRDTVLLSKSGSIIQIQGNSFEDKDGDAPVKVKIELVEALTIKNMLKNGLSTASHDQLLESDGMIFLDARNEEGVELKVVSGKAIYIEIPSLNNVPDIQIFNGQFNDDGQLIWSDPKPTDKHLSKIPFDQLDFYPSGYTRPNSFNSASLDNSTDVKSVYLLSQDTAYYTDEAINYCGINRGLIGALYDKQQEFQHTLIATREFETRMKYIHKSCNAEVFMLYVTNTHLNLWEIDSMAYEVLLREKNSQANTFKIFKDQRKTKIKEASVKDKLFAEHLTKSIKRFGKLQKDEHLKELTMHSFSTTTLGWINCDRFLNDPNAVPLKLEVIATNVDKNQFCKTYLILSSTKSILDLGRYDNGTFHVGFGDENFMNLPEGEKARLVSIANNGTLPMLGIQEITLGAREIEKVALKSVTVEVFKEQLDQYIESREPAILTNEADRSCCRADYDYQAYSDIF